LCRRGECGTARNNRPDPRVIEGSAGLEMFWFDAPSSAM